MQVHLKFISVIGSGPISRMESLLPSYAKVLPGQMWDITLGHSDDAFACVVRIDGDESEATTMNWATYTTDRLRSALYGPTIHNRPEDAIRFLKDRVL